MEEETVCFDEVFKEIDDFFLLLFFFFDVFRK